MINNYIATLRRGATLFVAALFASVLMMSCTQNDGRIGDLFGTWVLESVVDAEGAELPLPDSELFWSFQSTVVCFKVVQPYHIYDDYWGSWQRNGSLLMLDFENSDDMTATGGGLYSVPPGYYFTEGELHLQFAVRRLDNKRMELLYEAADGETLTYLFYKTK